MLLSSEDSIRIELGILLSAEPSTCLMSNKLFLFSMIMIREAAGTGKCAFEMISLRLQPSPLTFVCVFLKSLINAVYFPVLFYQKSCCSYWFSTLCGEFCVKYLYELLASLGKCALNQHISTKTRALLKLNQTRCQNFAGLHSFLHGGSDKQPVYHSSRSNKWFLSFSQLANDTKW